MTRDEARGIAAKAWVHPNNRRRVMEPSICEAFADILLDEVEKAKLDPSIKNARFALKKAFKDDPGFRKTYEANIAEILLADQDSEAPANLATRADCNVLADQLIKRILES
jgi:hypothetical protein